MGIYDDLEKYTASALLQTALNAARSDVDKREGSILFDTLSPLCFLASKLISVMKNVAENSDIQTANGDFLDWAASQFGIYRTEATASIREAKATPNVSIPVSSRFSTQGGLNLTWICTEVLKDGHVVLKCETPGAIGGADYGFLTPEENIEGLKVLEFSETRNPGADAERDQSFRIRFWRELQRESFGGNFADYQRWIFSKFATAQNGATLKAISFFPAWNGGGTIKIIPFVEDATGALTMPSSSIMEALKEYLDPEPEDGKGAGIAPIGHRVTIESPNFLDWDISAKVMLKAGENEISEEARAAAENELRAAISATQINSLTTADSNFPTPSQYSFDFTRSMVINAIMGDAINPRFRDVIELKINGIDFSAVFYVQTAEEHILPRFKSLALAAS